MNHNPGRAPMPPRPTGTTFLAMKFRSIMRPCNRRPGSCTDGNRKRNPVMAMRIRSWRVGGLGLLLLVGLTTMAFAQFGGTSSGAKPVAPPTLEYTQQEVQAN